MLSYGNSMKQVIWSHFLETMIIKFIFNMFRSLLSGTSFGINYCKVFMEIFYSELKQFLIGEKKLNKK